MDLLVPMVFSGVNFDDDGAVVGKGGRGGGGGGGENIEKREEARGRDTASAPTSAPLIASS